MNQGQGRDWGQRIDREQSTDGRQMSNEGQRRERDRGGRGRDRRTEKGWVMGEGWEQRSDRQ